LRGGRLGPRQRRVLFRHTLFTALVASLIVVALTVAVLNEVLERRQRERWSVLAQYALFDLVGAARLVWTGLLELAGLAPEGRARARFARGWLRGTARYTTSRRRDRRDVRQRRQPRNISTA
jgi:hypothetical protein